MKYFDYLLIVIFGLVGAHIPKAFTLLYLALFISWLFAVFVKPRSLASFPANQRKLFHVVQLMVLIFSFTFPLAMIHFGFWQFVGREGSDVVNAFLLPNCLFWWGAHMARRDLRLFIICMLAYGFGGLIWLMSSLFMTSGFNWYMPSRELSSLSMIWGNQPTINVRSVEQNGILNIVLIPVSVYFFVNSRKLLGLSFLLLGVMGLLSILPLAPGRLWIASLFLAMWPCFCLVCMKIVSGLKLLQVRNSQIIFLAATGLVAISSFSINNVHLFCDERFYMYQQAIFDWRSLFSGGRILNFKTHGCTDHDSFILSLLGSPDANVHSLHSVPLDVLATVGIWGSLPMVVFLVISLYKGGQFCISFIYQDFHHASKLVVLWSLLAALIPQWLFQPLVYGDSLLYYLSYALMGAILTMRFPLFIKSARSGVLGSQLG